MTTLAPLAVGPDPMLTPRVHEVLEVIPEIPGVITLRGAPVDGAPLPFLPAQVSMVGAFGVGEAAISISSPVTETAFQEWTIRRAGAITGALTSLRPGDQFWTRGPFGRPWDLDLDGRDVLIVAGGIGLAPLRSAVYAVLGRAAAFRNVTLVVGARTSRQFLFAGQYDEWRDAGIDVRLTIDRAEPGWHGAVGFVPQYVAEIDLAAADTSVLLCGPDIMMRLTADLLVDRGVEADQIQLTLERNMQCGNGLCGHCQLGPLLVCRDGPVVRYPAVRAAMAVEEL
jgi:NAD(P)H-flavin reductase